MSVCQGLNWTINSENGSGARKGGPRRDARWALNQASEGWFIIRALHKVGIVTRRPSDIWPVPPPKFNAMYQGGSSRESAELGCGGVAWRERERTRGNR